MSWRTVGIISALMIAVSLTGIVFPTRVNYRDPKLQAKLACRANLRTIEGAKATWASESGTSASTNPSAEDLFGWDKYLRERPVCPAGGNYTLGVMGKKPRCSIPDHTF